MFKRILLATTLLTSLLATQTASAQAIAWSEVNTNLAEITNKVKSQLPYLTTLDFKFDPISNLDADTVKMKISAGTDKAAWEGGQAVLDTDLAMQAVVNSQDATKRDVSGTLALGLTTKVLPALKHLLKEPINTCASQPARGTGYEDLSNATYCEILAKIAASTKVADLRVAVVDGLQKYQSQVAAYITEQQALLAAEADAEKKADIQAGIDSAQNDLAQLATLQVSGAGDELAIRYVYEMTASDSVAFTFDILVKSDVTSGTIGLSTKVLEADYQNYKGLIVSYVSAIQSKTQDSMESIEQILVSYAGFLEEFVTK